jgi:heme/copper-type cytochrome/quinol oxidase subunit 4
LFWLDIELGSFEVIQQFLKLSVFFHMNKVKKDGIDELCTHFGDFQSQILEIVVSLGKVLLEKGVQ